MRCKTHCTDLSSIIGVCSSCLRERLLTIIIAQEQTQAQTQVENSCNSDTKPALQSSVSPYDIREKSDVAVATAAAVQRPNNKSRLNHSLSDQRFYKSPQIAVNSGGCIGHPSSDRKKHGLIRLLFRSNNKDGDADLIRRVSVPTSKESCGAGDNPTSSTSRFSSVLPGAGGSQKKASGVDESSAIATSGLVRKQRCVPDRGMSPVRSSDEGGEDEISDGSSDYESAESCKQTPRKTASHPTTRRGGVHKNVSDLIFGLSPLVRASPNRLWNHKAKPPAEGFDNRASTVPHLSNVKLFCANRSRKLADFGRSDPNR